ncbi:MAG: hypothetical protein COB92_04430 [Robiginitomaculum sp.]|nr:MAG: hypothetical protein COB92_04430 [Robiginitomaculum sp.]
MEKIMRKLFIGLVVIVVLLVVAALILPSLIPASVYKDKITDQVSSTLGRDVQIAGGVKLSVFPTLVVKADLVTIGNAEGFSNQAFATMESLEAKVKLMPLFKKQVEISAFTLVNPEIFLEKTKDGQINWTFGNETSKPTQQVEGAFARDGRYTDLQITLGKFSLENGSINYSDAQTGANYDVKAVNMKLSMPGLDKPVRAKGDMIVNDMPIDIEIKLDTPKAFLSGDRAPLILKFKSELINLSANGRFTPSAKITFDVDFDADIPSTAKLDAFLKLDNPYVALTETANIKGNLTFDGVNMVGKGTQVSLKSDILTTDFSGNFSGDLSAGGIPSASGDLKINVVDIKKLQDALGMAIPQLAAFTTVDIFTNLDTDGKVTTAKNVSINIKGAAITANYFGAAKFGNALSLAGNFNANSPSISALLPKLGVNDLAAANVLGDLSVSGNVNGMVDALTLDDLDFKTKGGDLVASYAGQVKLGKDMSFNGRFDAASLSVKRLATTGEIALPYADALGALQASGDINGSASSLTMSNVKAALTGGMLNLNFEGDVTTGKALSYDGLVKLDIPSLRQLAAIGGTTLAADTKAGQVYGPVSVSGQAKGNMNKASFNGASIQFDDLVGNGDFSANLTNKPYITGKLDMQGLDIRPYQAAMYANRPEGVQPWSEEPLNMSFLNLFDGSFTINTPNVVLSSMELGQSTIKTTVKNGVLKTNIPNVSLYGGKGTLDMELNASGAVPKVALDFALNDVDGQGLLGAVANFTKLSGNTGTTMSIRGAGKSQAEIMRSLSGKGDFELAKGIVTGVDIEQFTSNFSSIDAILKTRALPAGIGSSYNTPFNKIAGLFTIKNGVVTIGDFALTANTVLAEGAGKLDLGRQTVDFSLRPRLKDGKGLAGFGIPIKFSGDFGGIKAGLDSDLMTKIVAARAKAELQNQLTNQVGGNLGDIIGGLLGTPQQPQDQAPQPKQQTKDPLAGLLGDLFGDKKADTEPKPEDPEKEEEKKEEDPLEKALKNLFGGD